MAEKTTKTKTKAKIKTVEKRKDKKKVEVSTGNRLQKIAEKLWQKNLIGTSQVLGCWLYLASPYRETKWGAHVSSVEIFYMNDGKLFMQYFANYYEEGSETAREHHGHRMFNTFAELEKEVLGHFTRISS